MNIAKVIEQVRTRMQVITAALTKKRWVSAVMDIASRTPGGVFVHDVIGDREPLWWYQNPACGNQEFDQLDAHDYSWGDAAIPAMSSEPEVSRFLAKLILLKGYKNVLEVGSFLGYTTSHMATALRGEIPGRITCVDIDKRYLAIAERNVRHFAGVQVDAKFINGNSLNPAVVAALDAPFDLIFIDSAHDENTTRKEISLYSPLLAEGGMLAFHDAISWPGVRRPVNEVREKYHSMVFATSRGCGLAVLERR